MKTQTQFKLISFILTVTLLLTMSVTVFANQSIEVYLNNEKIQFDVEPLVVNGRTMVPMRAIFEKLGAEVTWDNGTNTAVAYKNDEMKGVAVTIGSPYMVDINLKAIPLDVPAMLHNGRTLVPLRAVSEAFDCDVIWDGETSTVNIYSKGFVDFSKESAQTTIEVSTVDELLNNIGSNKHIILTEDYYNLSDAGAINNPHVTKQQYWDDSYIDGYIIKNVINMTIEGNAQIATDDIYADVLTFENCGKITLDGLTIGHTEYFDKYRCEGAVVALMDCQKITVKNCNLYGCGAIGVKADAVADLLIDKTNIYDCSFSAVTFSQCKNTNVNESNIYDSIYFSGLCQIDNSTVTFNKCVVRDNETNGWEGFIITNDWSGTDSIIAWNDCKFINNTFDVITNYETKYLVFSNCEFENNAGNMEHPSAIYLNCSLK